MATSPLPDSVVERCAATTVRESFERLRDELDRGDCTDAWVAVCLRDHRPDLPPWDRWAIWEQLEDGLSRLECIRTPGGCVCHDYAETDLERLEHMADADVENAVRKLTGRTA